MDRRSEAALRTAVTIVPGTPVLGIGLGSGELALAMLRLSIDYAYCETEQSRVDALMRLAAREQEAVPNRIQMDTGSIDCADGQFDWVFILESDSPAGIGELTILLATEIVRILKSGGWIWLACTGQSQSVARSTVFHELGCVDASPITHAISHEFCHRIIRKVDAKTPY